MRLFFKFGILSLIVLFISSCHPRIIPENAVKLERKRTNELVSALDSMAMKRPNYFYSKIKCDFNDTNRNIGFKASIRMVKDSVLNTLITYAAVPVANALITPDSVIISNKREKCVIRQTVGYIKEQFGVAFNFRNIEELFLGLPVGFDTTQKYFQIHDPYNYIISSHKKREIRRENRNKPEKDRDRERGERERDGIFRREDQKEDEEDVFLNYYLSNDIKTIKRIFIDSPNDTTTIDIQYISRDSVDGYFVPNEVKINIVTPRNHIVIDMDYDKSEVNVPQEIYFVIPEGYGECGSEE